MPNGRLDSATSLCLDAHMNSLPYTLSLPEMLNAAIHRNRTLQVYSPDVTIRAAASGFSQYVILCLNIVY